MVWEQVRRRPEEVHAAQEPQEQRRISQRGERAADVGHQKDEEDDDVRVVPPVVIGAEDRPDHDHRGAGRADDARNQGAQSEQQRIQNRGAVKIAAHHDSAGHGEQSEEQQNEGDVFEQRGMDECLDGWKRAIPDGKRQDDQGGPHRSNLALVVLPEVRRCEWKYRDRQQHAGEGERPLRPNARPVERCGERLRR